MPLLASPRVTTHPTLRGTQLLSSLDATSYAFCPTTNATSVSCHQRHHPHLTLQAFIPISLFGHSCWLRPSSSSFHASGVSPSFRASGVSSSLLSRRVFVLRALALVSLSHRVFVLRALVWPCTSGAGHDHVLQVLVVVSRLAMYFGCWSSSLVWPCTSGAGHNHVLRVLVLVSRLAVYFGCRSRVLRVPVMSYNVFLLF
ncbi:hypothetical protein C8F01DRAFT_1376022 [Mycena amicta]|nr:hypothetical protein C8F01DRAFT_1376022 [Mycena amicta]